MTVYTDNPTVSLSGRYTGLEIAAGAVQREVIDTEEVRKALENITEVFGTLNPYEQKKLIALVLQRAVLSEDSLELTLYAPKPRITGEKPAKNMADDPRRPPSTWLPGLDSN